MLLIYSDPKIRLIGEGIISLRVNPWCEVLLGETKGNKGSQ
jgi:cytolysin (calcineurin-like family phosphatase)